MVSPPRLAAIVVAASLAFGCGSASDGAASARGHLFEGIAPWDTPFDFTGYAQIRGAGPFRIAIVDVEGDADDLHGSAPQRSIHLALSERPASGQVILMGSLRGPEAYVESRTALFGGWPEPLDGEARLDDGSFVARAVSGFLQIDRGGQEPGDGVSGRFVLELPTGRDGRLERIEGAFAGALLD